MKKWNILRAMGFLTALVLVAFGGVANLVRTVRLGAGKLFRNR